MPFTENGELTGFQCTKCGRFLSGVYAKVNGLETIVAVFGRCSRCGEVDITSGGNWDYTDFEEPQRGKEER